MKQHLFHSLFSTNRIALKMQILRESGSHLIPRRKAARIAIMPGSPEAKSAASPMAEYRMAQKEKIQQLIDEAIRRAQEAIETEVRDRAALICEICCEAGLENCMAGFIRNGMSVDQVRAISENEKNKQVLDSQQLVTDAQDRAENYSAQTDSI